MLVTLSDCESGRRLPTTLAFPPLIDFRSFRPSLGKGLQWAFRLCRKQQKSIKVGHSSCYHLPRAHSCGYVQPSTRCAWAQNPSPQTKHRRRAPARASVGRADRKRPSCATDTCKSACHDIHHSQPTHARAHVCGISLVAKDQGNMRIVLTGAGNRKSAHA